MKLGNKPWTKIIPKVQENDPVSINILKPLRRFYIVIHISIKKCITLLPSKFQQYMLAKAHQCVLLQSLQHIDKEKRSAARKFGLNGNILTFFI